MSFKNLLNKTADYYIVGDNTVKDSYGGTTLAAFLEKTELPCRIRLLNESEKIILEKENCYSTHRIYFELESGPFREKDYLIIDSVPYDIIKVNFCDDLLDSATSHYEIDVEVKDPRWLYQYIISSSSSSSGG